MAVPEKLKVRFNLIFFLVMALGLSYLMATQVLSVLQKRMSVYAIFPDAGGVFTSQEVTYRGVTVGQVGTLSIVPQGVKIQLLINDGEKIPADDVEARVMFKSAVGEQFVDLLPTSDGQPYLHDGSVIPISQTSIPVSTQALLTTLEAVLRGVPPRAVRGAITELGNGLTGEGQDLAQILESSADLADLFRERSPAVQGLLRHGTKVGGAFLHSKEDFVTAIRQLVPVSAALSQSTGDLERLLRGSNLASDQILALLRKSRPDVEEFLNKFAAVNKLQALHRDDINALLINLTTALDRINHAFEPDTGLVRFGLVQDMDNPACSYGTARRPPSDRSDRKPPKDARCGGSSSSSTSTAADPATAPAAGSRGTGSEQSGVAGLLGAPTSGLTTGPKLPARMSDWSWTLVYLNGI